MTFEYFGESREQLVQTLGGVDEFEDQINRTAAVGTNLRIAIRSLTPGLSGASVFLVTRQVNDQPLVSLVVKVASSVPLIREERDNYEKYIESKLQSVPRLIASGSSRLLIYEFGGALAAFNPETLRSGYARTEASAVATLMTRVAR
jgi:hypothetical protein